jgi:hypothetical protein
MIITAKKTIKGKIIVAFVLAAIKQQRVFKGIKLGIDELTKPYHNWEIIRIAVRILFKITCQEKNRNDICSPLV